MLLLTYLAGELADAPVLAAAAYRDIEVHPGDPVATMLGTVADGATTVVVPVRGLAEHAVGEMIRSFGLRNGTGAAGTSTARTSDETIEEDIVATMHARTSGNPFFVQELSRLLHADGHEAAGLPASVREVVNQRIARLPAQSRQVLRAAAVLGRDFGQLPLSAVVGCSELAALAALQPAAAVQLIAADPDQRGRYRFNHVLVQEALYSSLDVIERTRLHSHAARAIEERYRDDDAYLGDLAYHAYHACLGIGADEVAGHDDEGGTDARAAFRHTLAAGRWAGGRLAHEESARWLSMALELADRFGLAAGSGYIDLLTELGEAWARAGHRDSARRACDRAAEMAARCGARAQLARAALGAGTTVVTAGTVDWALVSLLTHAIKANTDNHALRARLLSRLAIELYWHAGGEPARERSAEALEVAGVSGDDAALGVALHARQFTLRGAGHLTERIAIGRRLVTLATRADDADLANPTHVFLAADLLRRQRSRCARASPESASRRGTCVHGLPATADGRSPGCPGRGRPRTIAAMTTTTNTATTDTNTTPEAKLRARREAIVRTHMEAEGRHDVAATLNTFAEANYDVVALGAPTNGPQAVEELLTMLFGAFPDFAAEALSIHHGDDIVFVDTRMTGTHHGPWAGVPATGRPIDVRLRLRLPLRRRPACQGDRLLRPRDPAWPDRRQRLTRVHRSSVKDGTSSHLAGVGTSRSTPCPRRIVVEPPRLPRW
ncbi:ATP-binding protein [Frankia sp. Cas3]|uniref:ATP-binding protein n=1 Tax=Frankia sp. Cas3 TaxID=3073926 RepID=UPI002AD33100|nr:ester cyclase [Frankia sp. Cas3]